MNGKISDEVIMYTDISKQLGETNLTSRIITDTNISKALAKHHYLLKILGRIGFAFLQKAFARKFMARTTTIEKTCARLHIDTDLPLVEINMSIEEIQ